jgi:REP element-mobilizing transposase RayT
LFVHPRTLSIATVMEKIKASSSGWAKERWPGRGHFGWQTGYAAFSVSKSHVEEVERYIRNQEEHHRKVSFQEELLAFLKKHGIEYDPRYVFV